MVHIQFNNHNKTMPIKKPLAFHNSHSGEVSSVLSFYGLPLLITCLTQQEVASMNSIKWAHTILQKQVSKKKKKKKKKKGLSICNHSRT